MSDTEIEPIDNKLDVSENLSQAEFQDSKVTKPRSELKVTSTFDLDIKKANSESRKKIDDFSEDGSMKSDVDEFMASDDGAIEKNYENNSDYELDMSFNKVYSKNSLIFKEELINCANMKEIEEKMVRKLNEKYLVDQRSADVHLRECYEIFKLHVSDIGYVFEDSYFKQKYSSLVNR